MIRNNNGYTVVTGASSGIGYETAKLFAKRGSNLILAARRWENLKNIKREILALRPETDVVIKAVDLSVSGGVFDLYEYVKGYPLKTWINNAGFGDYGCVGSLDLDKITRMLRLNVEATTVFSSLFVRDFKDTDGTQLINVSSCGGYRIVPNAVAYCASKFYIGAFTEGLARELRESGSKMQAKVFAPAATKTEFGKIANGMPEYDYDKSFGVYHTAAQAAELLLELYDGGEVVGLVDRENFSFRLCGPQFEYAEDSRRNQKI